jgi:hypothetical protein
MRVNLIAHARVGKWKKIPSTNSAQSGLRSRPRKQLHELAASIAGVLINDVDIQLALIAKAR